MDQRNAPARFSGAARRSTLFLCAGFGAVVLGPGRLIAAEPLPPRAVAQIRSLEEWKRGWTPTERRMSSRLLAAIRMSRGLPITPLVQSFPGLFTSLRLDARGVLPVDIKADVTDGLLSELARLGAEVESALPQYRAIRARIPLLQVEAAAVLSGVQFIEPAAPYVTHTGPTTSQGDAAHQAPAVRALGVMGAGVKVGVISDGVASLAARQAAGDLPAGVTVVAAGAAGEDEGTAMLEIVYDLAPQAQLYFASADGGPAAMANSIIALKNAGCRVIVDDVTYLNEGAFQDDVIARAVSTVTAAGVLYFSSAANSGNKDDGTSGTWEGDFVDSGTNLDGVPVHSFEGQTSDAITVATGPISLKWSDPLGASGNDYDLFVFDSTLTSVLASSLDVQNGTGNPFEFIATSQPVGARIVVAFFNADTGGQPRALRVDTNRGRLAISTAGNTYGHNAAASAVTVGATDANRTGGGAFSGGAANPTELFSSDGPRRMFLKPDGTPITPGNVLFGTGGGTTLQKPDITAADCVATGTPGFLTFCGTSAAAPHAGAIAALALSMASAPSTALVKGAMIAAALDIEAAGFDRDSGVGIAMADRTVSALQPPVGGTARFFTLTPCRAVDTRNAVGPLGGPALNGGLQRSFFLAGLCGVPATAKAVSVNVTITSPSTPGDLRIYPGGVAAPLVSTINFTPGQTRANNAVLQVGGGTTAAVTIQNDAATPVHFILDVNGYFQ